MGISHDYKDLFKTLNKHKVKYLIVGAYAVTFYTEPRFTKDLDIWVSNDIINARRLYPALASFGAPLKGISVKDFTNKKTIYQHIRIPRWHFVLRTQCKQVCLTGGKPA